MRRGEHMDTSSARHRAIAAIRERVLAAGTGGWFKDAEHVQLAVASAARSPDEITAVLDEQTRLLGGVFAERPVGSAERKRCQGEVAAAAVGVGVVVEEALELVLGLLARAARHARRPKSSFTIVNLPTCGGEADAVPCRSSCQYGLPKGNRQVSLHAS